MRNPVFKASNPNGALFQIKMNFIAVLLAACLLLQCGVSSFVNQDDNDLVFEDEGLQVIRDQNLNNSSQVDSKYSNVISLDDDVLINTQDDRKSDEKLSERIGQYFDRFKRQIDLWNPFGNLLKTPTEEPVSDETSKVTSVANNTPTTTRKKRTSARTTRQANESEGTDTAEDDDDSPDNEEGDGEDTTEPTFSGDPPTNTITPTKPAKESKINKSYFRIFIKLLEPYSYDFVDHSSSIFIDYSNNITVGVQGALDVPDFSSARLVSIISTADISQSKAIVDLEFSGAESKERIEGLMSANLAVQLKLGSLQASPVDLYVREYGEKKPFQCSSPSDIPCKDSEECYPPSGRCNSSPDCPDHTDDEDCPPLDRCRSDDKFVCPNSNGIIICGNDKCNGKKECPGGEDEPPSCDRLTAACVDWEFVCNGNCISLTDSSHCNGVVDCAGGTDEVDCPKSTSPPPAAKLPCLESQFSCGDSTCIDSARRCDGIRDCPDDTDELDCPKTASPPPPSSTEAAQEPSPTPSPSPPSPSTEPEPIPTTASVLPYFTSPTASPTRDENHTCTDDEFRCTSSKICIPLTKKCDGHYGDCYVHVTNSPEILDKSDESNCPLTCNSSIEFKCRTGAQCISLEGRCDGLNQCYDKSDEENCEISSPTSSTSLSTTSIPTTSTTSTSAALTNVFTPASSIEFFTEREVTCRADQILCHDLVTCIDGSQRCDRNRDCPGGEDEGGCPTASGESTSTDTLSSPSKTCSNIEYQCKNGICISESFRCDNFTDCVDGSDEENCASYILLPSPTPAECTSNQFKCGDGSCIDISGKCDRRNDCADGSDEFNCTRNVCLPSEYRCKDGHCIPFIRRCDKIVDCRDGTDESQCEVCNSDEFQCNDRHCIPLIRRCDGFDDCRDGTDENNCQTPTTSAPRCQANEFKCDDNHCIPGYRRCDGRPDCRDYTDERNCDRTTSDINEFVNLRAYPTDQIIKASQEVVFQCRDEGPFRAEVTWTRGNGLPLPANSVVGPQGRLEIPNIQLSHSGPYICKVVEPYTSYPGSQITVQLTVEPFIPITSRPYVQCGYNESFCLNGDCIRKELICNGRYDCADGSDESRCNSHGCEPDQFKCANNMCVQKHWLCDGEDDCKDGSDEANCKPNPPGSPCRHDEFQCTGGRTQQCILKAFQCDGQNDCFDGSDEVGCSKVVISQAPPPMIQLNAGETFTITCTAVGIPVPEIVWRLNWGHVPSKCITTSINGVGTLTCYDIQQSDAGAYSCEGINIKGFVLATPDCILVVIPPRSHGCPTGQFNDLALSQDDCIGCFCFGVTSSCQGTNLFVFELTPPLYQINQFSFLSVLYNPVSNEIDFNTNDLLSLRTSVLSSDSVHVKGSFDPNQGSYPYFSFLSSFNGNQLKSYGGYIKYNIRYDPNGSPLELPLIIISGNGRKIFFNGTEYFTRNGTQLVSSRGEQVSAHLFHGSWFKEGSGRPGGGDVDPSTPSTLASREDIMMILVNVEQAVLKLQSTNSPVVDTIISKFRLDSAGATNTGLGKAAYVEQCSCPTGYTGLSCESCASGYSRVDGDWLGRCYRIETCAPGSYGDPLLGIPCRPCPCPSSNPSNQFGRTCYRDSDNQPTCQCPPGYAGRRCETCAPGYTGNPLIPGDYCKPIVSACNPSGSTDLSPSGPCNCKPFATGYYCDQCKPSSFYLAPNNPYGCISCFCMGVSTSCSSSSWFRQVITTTFVRSSEEFKIVRRQDIERAITGELEVRPNEREVVFSSFSPNDTAVYYWLLPQRYLGDKVTSYGGVLNYTLRYVPLSGSQITRNSAPDVEIISKNEIRLYHYARDIQVQPNTLETVTVPLLEQHWERENGEPAGREHLLMALAGLNAILIKATYTSSTAEVGLQSVSLETAEDYNTGLRPAYEVEECRCPAGYRGLSCQECDSGYYRVDHGLYLGICERCNCNGHSQECDAETGTCLNCANFTAGPDCGQCLSGYAGDPKSIQGCQSPSYQPCNCDSRGSAQSECVGGRCVCKANVIGESCSTCRPGTFDLQESHPTGCLDCWCSGVTNQCSSSNLFVVPIPMSILDNNHGFTLTQADRRPFYNPRFELDIGKNQIGFDYAVARGQQLYWSLPPKFTGSKITSYGGNLTWTQGYYAPVDSLSVNDYDLIIYGDGITIFWSGGAPVLPNTSETRSVKLVESDFIRVTASGRQRATRADVLKVLSSVETILIRATSRYQTSYVFISDVSMDTAVGQQLSTIRATQVESCRCPLGYRGLSCEFCQRGYYLDEFSGRGKECKKCPCNDHEESCSIGSNAQVVCKCSPAYSGTYCEDVLSSPLNIQLTPPRVNRPIGSKVNFTCSFSIESGEGLYIRFVKNYTNNQEVPIDDQNGILQRKLDSYNWEGKKSVVIVLEPNLQYVVCQIVDSSGFSVGRIHAKIYRYTPVNSPPDNSSPGAISSTEVNWPTQPPPPPPASQPTIIITIREPQIQIVALGTTVRYNCRAQSLFNLPVTIRWSKEGGFLPVARSVVDDYGNLVVTNASPEDSGIYVCTAYDSRTSASERVQLTVGDSSSTSPPRISLRPGGTVSLFVGQPLSVTCEATGIPAPTVEIIRSSGPLVGARNGLRNAVYNVPNVQKSDEGVYYCRASNSAGKADEQVVVRVQDIPSVVTDPPVANARVTIEPNVFVGLPGDNINLQCSIQTNTLHRIEWRRYPNSPLQSSAIDRSGVLYIPSATPEDAGVYVCSAISEQTGVVLGQAEVSVSLGPAGGRPAVLTVDPEKQTVSQGTLAKINCFVSGDPNARVTWRKGNDNLPTYAQIVGNELRISQPEVRDRGVYTCELNSPDGTILQAHSVLEVIKRQAPGAIVYPAEKQLVRLGGVALIQCQANRGDPTPTLRWSRPNNQRISSHVEIIDGVLRFNRITEEDDGQYICTAENIVGSVTAIATLEVLAPPAISITPRSPYIVQIGQRARIECSASGKPSPSVYWIEQPSVYSNGVSQDLTPNSVIEISRVQQSDSKEYTCVAENSYGRVEERIQLVVTGDSPVYPPPPSPSVESSIAPDEEIIFIQGGLANLRCNVGTSPNPYNIIWMRDGSSELPANHRIYNGELILYSITKSMAGKYSCLGVGYDNEVLFSKSINLRIISGPPKITLNPTRQMVRPGDNAYVECLVEGDQPIIIEWSKKAGRFTPSVTAVEGRLSFRGITVYDAGQYVCSAKNAGGDSEAVAEVLVNSSPLPSIQAQEHVQSTYEGYDLDLKCVVNVPVTHQVTWRREHGPLPRNSQILGDTLRLVNLRPEDADRYICEVISSSGIGGMDHIDVQVEHVSNVSLSIEASKDHIYVGETVSLLCNVLGDADGNVIWSKGDGEFESNVYIDKQVLRIAVIQQKNNGVYRCSTYASGALKFVDYVVSIEREPDNYFLPPPPVAIKTVKYGQNIDLDCDVNLLPPVNYSWIVHSYDKSQRRIVNSNKISVHNLTVNESGLYTCSASNGTSSVNIPRVLVVTEIIPAFSRNSYLTLRPLINAENHFQIEITFRPKSDSGLILYTGQKNDGTGDYVSFGLNYGVPEFRFDVGSGPAVIKGSYPLRMNVWHTARLVRDKREGFMEINRRENYTGSSPGSFERLDLQFPLFVGGLPTETAYNNSGFVSGFEGCVNSLLINGREANLKKEMIGFNNLEDCDNCKENPCQNNGVCQQTLTPSGYTCVCLPGNSGENCELNKAICYLDSCGTGKCLENENGIECQCPIGKTGTRCEKNLNIDTPAFLKNSWLAYQAPLLKKKFRLIMKLKPMGQSYVDDGLIFYIAENENGSGDYISLYISNSFAELRFKVLSTEDSLRSNHYLIPNEEVQVNISMSAAQVMFIVGNEPAVAKEFNPRAESAELKLSTPLYVGGVDKNTTKLPDDVLVKTGFHGCISMLDVSGTSIKMLQSSISSSNINDCFSSFGDICHSNMPCQNSGICKSTRNTYKCECAFGFSGTNCERQKDMCEVLNNPCQNNAKCIGTANTFKCHCGLGFTGEYCERQIAIEEHVGMNGDGYVELPGSLLPHSKTLDITIDIDFTTRSHEALLFWNGPSGNVNGKEYDYIAIGITNGYVELKYQADRIEKTLKASDHKVNDGKAHLIRVLRRGEVISFELDKETSEMATLEYRFNINGNIFLGGTPNTLMTGNLYREGFVGCIHALSIQNSRTINFGSQAQSARNLERCSASPYQESNSVY